MSLAQYRERPHWSYSSLNQLLNICSLQWYFEKVERVPRDATPLPLAFGSAYHRTMEWMAEQRMNGGLPKEPDVRERFDAAWSRQCELEKNVAFGDKMDRESCAQQGMDLCAAYLQSIDPEEEVIGISEVFVVPVGNSERPLIGELDCVVRKGQQVTVVDWKTSARRWPKTQAHGSLQATAYLYAYEQLHPGPQPDFRFDVVVKNKTPVVELHETSRAQPSFDRLQKLVAVADRIVDTGLYYPSDSSFFCGGCPLKTRCRAWDPGSNTQRKRKEA